MERSVDVLIVGSAPTAMAWGHADSPHESRSDTHDHQTSIHPDTSHAGGH